MIDLRVFFPAGLKGVVFDCDGVMIDSEAANRHFYNLVLAALNLPPMTDAQEKYAFMSTTMQALLKITPPEDHPRLEKAVASVDYQGEVLPRTRLMPGFRGFMEACHSSGLKLAIDTNRTDEGIQRILDFFSLPPYFEPVISASNAAPKPSPAGAESICKAWGFSPRQILYIGDSETDREAAAGAGMIFAAFGGKGLPGDFQAPNFAELQASLDALTKKIS